MRAASVLLAALAAALAVPAIAEEIHPIEARSIALKAANGVAYYTVQADGYEVVVTMAAAAGVTPMRFVAKLNDGQKVTVSVPGELGAPGASIDIKRIGDQVHVMSGEKFAGAQ